MSIYLKHLNFFNSADQIKALDGQELKDDWPEEVLTTILEEKNMLACCNQQVSLSILGEVDDALYHANVWIIGKS